MGKKPTGDNTICRHTKAFDSIHRGKMEQILQAYGVPKETITVIMILYRNTKVKVHSTDGDTEYLDIVARVLQGDTLAPYLFIICLDYVLRISIDKIKENGFELTEKKQKVPRKNNYWCRLRRWQQFRQIHPTKLKHYFIVWNELPQALASMSMHTKWNTYALIKQANFHTWRKLSETSRQVHIPRKQCLINWKRHWHASYEGMDSYR